MKSGIYICECIVSDGIYIGKTGSSKGFKNRWSCELSYLKNNKCHNIHWQRAWNKYGESNFEWRIQEECCDEVINQREIAWIKYYREQGRNVYNFTNGGDGLSGYRFSKLQRKNLSKAKTGKNNPFYGKKHNKETRTKMIENGCGIKINKQTGKNNPFYGKKHNKETIIKLSEARKRYWANKKAGVY